MHRTRSNAILLGLAVLGVTAGLSGCTQDQTDGRVGYETTAVRDADGETVVGTTQPGGVYAAYQQPPGFPLTISTTAYLETKSRPPGSSPDTGSEDSSGWSRTDLRSGTVSVLGDSVCSKQAVDCDGDSCSVELEMPDDGYCVVSVSLVGGSGTRGSDCWGYGWVDGRDSSAEKRDREHERLIDKRDELCGR